MSELSQSFQLWPNFSGESIVVTAQQMHQIETRLFEAGMPVPALMEKAAGLVADRIRSHYPLASIRRVGVMVGPGHNGGDALVIARELHGWGYTVKLYQPLEQLKPLSAQHACFAEHLGLPVAQQVDILQDCQLIVDGLFGFGLTRSLTGELAQVVRTINDWSQPVVSIDLPSGLETDTGAVLGSAIQADRTYCLGLWKRAFFQDQALPYLGKAERIDFGIPQQDIQAVLSEIAPTQIVTGTLAKIHLPWQRSLQTHKYRQGHVLLVCGSHRYAGAALLTGLGARASGVGMLSIAVPASLKSLMVSRLPEALIVDCPETPTGAIAQLPPSLEDLSPFSAIVCGPGLSQDATSVVESVLAADCVLVLDADGLNILATAGVTNNLGDRRYPTLLTPHLGEFRRLFPKIPNPEQDRIKAVQLAARLSGAIVLFKGARTAITEPNGATWLIPQSTPALARGGSGDVLSGLVGGAIAQSISSSAFDESAMTSTGLLKLGAIAGAAAWWHAQAGIRAAQDRSELGVDPVTLTDYLIPTLAQGLNVEDSSLPHCDPP